VVLIVQVSTGVRIGNVRVLIRIPIDLSRFQLKFGTVESLLALEIVEIEIEVHIDCFWVTCLDLIY